MSQEYVYACQRAELLGQVPPTEEEWAESQKTSDCDVPNQDELEDAVVQEVDQSDEGIGRIGGGLDELNSILNATQKKINRFKTVCGSLGTLLKIRVGSRSSTPDHKPLAGDNDAEIKETDETLTIEENTTTPSIEGKTTVTPRRVDINEKVGSHLDKLDSLITKAENAQYSMQHQTKQMKKILKK